MHQNFAHLTLICLQQKYIDNNYPDNGNWQDEAYNRGVRVGADGVVQKHEKQCLEDTPDECEEVGETAAQGTIRRNHVICAIDFHIHFAGY